MTCSLEQDGTRIQNCCHIAHVRPCDRGRELIEGLARSCERLQELIDGFVGTCQCHYNKAPADVYQPGQKTARIPPSMKKHQPVSLMLIGVVF